MTTIQETYSVYDIMPSLAIHQLRVAGVARMIRDHFDRALDAESVIGACLLHDMGNIIKSDLPHFPDFVQPEGLAHWQAVKDNFIKRYGTDEHAATMAIAREIGASEKVLSYMEQIGFSHLPTVAAGGSFEAKICTYADLRVAPRGVTSLQERLADGRARYRHKGFLHDDRDYEDFVRSAYEIERQIFAHTDIRPEDIDEENVQKLVGELREFTI